jgi:group I intron endonuclease
MPEKAYLYEIKNSVNGNCYIGSTINAKQRWMHHRTMLRKGKHHSFILQKAWDKYGEENFKFNILLICDVKDRFDYENRFMKLQNYNVLRTAHETAIRKQYKPTQEAIEKMRAGIKKSLASPEARERLRKARLGYKQTKEAIQKTAISKWKPVYCKEIEVSFLNQKYAAEYLGYARSTVTEALKRKGIVDKKFTLVRVA